MFAILLLLTSILLQPVDMVMAAEDETSPEAVEDAAETGTTEQAIVEEVKEEPKQVTDEAVSSEDSEQSDEGEGSVNSESETTKAPVPQRATTSSQQPTEELETLEDGTTDRTERASTSLESETTDGSTSTTASNADSASATSSSSTSSTTTQKPTTPTATTTISTTAPADGDAGAAATSTATTTTTTVVSELDASVSPPVNNVTPPVTDSDKAANSNSDETQPEVLGVASSTSSSSSAQQEALPFDITVQSNENLYQFSKQQCVSVGDGSYYCHTDVGTADLTIDRIYAAQDEDGDLEIYITIDGETSKITDNLYDDAAPEYDSESDTLVWHRLIDGRYQIIQYSLDDGEEVQITSSNTNSMEPSVAGGYVVWQEWDGNDWEIALYDGHRIEMLTDNGAHDVAPTVNDGYVMWTSSGVNGTQVAKVYDISSGVTQVIEGEHGGSISNPRFVLVYDTKFDNGDVITQGFNLESGVSEALAAKAGELPHELPDTDSTGEVRALLQQKISRDDFENQDDQVPTGPGLDPSLGSGATTTASTSASEQTSPELNLRLATSSPLELGDNDLIVEPFQASSTQEDISSSTDNLVE